jgi:hypothetical protein
MASGSGDPTALNFDTAATPTTLLTASGVTCAACQRALDTEYFDINGLSVCGACRDVVTRQAQTPRDWATLAKAGAFGVGAAIAGAALYYAVIKITNLEIGLVAIAIGYMVGYAVKRATAGRGGRRFQVLALVLTYWPRPMPGRRQQPHRRPRHPRPHPAQRPWRRPTPLRTGTTAADPSCRCSWRWCSRWGCRCFRCSARCRAA